MRFLKLAWRNARRNPRRTSLTVSAIALGVMALQCAWALFDGGNAQMIDSMTGNFVGHIQVHAKGYDADPAIERTFNADSAARVLAGDSRTQFFAPRLEGQALISGAENARGILVVGIDPATETRVTRLQDRMVAGYYLQPGDRSGVLLGETLAKSLGVKVGDEVAAITEALHGTVGAARYTVRGLFSTGNEMVDGMQAIVSLPDARNLFGIDTEVTTLAIRVADSAEADQVAADISVKLGEAYEALAWPKLLPAVSQSIAFHESVVKVIMVALFSIVAVSVANALMMAANERRREYGVMGALGVMPGQIFATIFYEGMLTGLLGFLIGGLLGSALILFFAHTGLDFGRQAAALKMMQGLGNVLYPVWSASRLAVLGAVVLGVTMLGSIFPAWRISRLPPMLAMKGLPTSPTSAPVNVKTSISAPLTLSLAWRNLRRQSFRTSLTVTAIALGLGAFVFIGSFANGYIRQAEENGTGLITGDAQILRPEFRNDMKASFAFPGQPVLEAVRRTSGVLAASGRVQVQAMVGAARNSKPVLLIGTDFESETQVTFLNRAIKTGGYLGNRSLREIVLGRELADSLSVRVGEKVIVTTQNRNGDLASEAFRIVGVFDTGVHGIDKAIVYVHLHHAQHLLELGDLVTNIALRMDPSQSPMLILSSIQETLATDEWDVLSWRKLLPELEQLSEVSRRSLLVVLAVTLMMVAAVVGNTILMGVTERTREFGTLLALGAPPKTIVRMVLLETAIMASIAIAVGLALGVSLTLAHLKSGIDMTSHGVTSVPGVTNIVFPRLSWSVVIEPMLVLPVVALLAAWQPSRRASRMDPINAMRC